MQPYKLLACLVTLQLTSVLPLQAADLQDFRTWTDLNGRTMTARIVGTPDADTVKIERQDGRVFVVPLKTFSEADRAYARIYAGQGSASSLAEATPTTWMLLNAAGDQPGSTYQAIALDKILDDLNQRIAIKEVKTAAGLPMKVRTEPADLASRVKLSGELPDMATATFIKKIAQINGLAIKTDAAGMIVIVDKTPATTRPVVANNSSVFGVAGVP